MTTPKTKFSGGDYRPEHFRFVRKSDLLKVVPAKTRRERIIEEMAAEFPRLLDETFVVPPAPGTAEKWLTCYEAAVKVVDGDA